MIEHLDDRLPLNAIYCFGPGMVIVENVSKSA